MVSEGIYYGFVFFFQAEDGIRDVAVTGVQTCALPICQLFDLAHGLSATLRHGHVRPVTPPGHSAFLSGTHDSMALFMSNDTKRSSWSLLISVSSASAPPSSNWRDKSVFCAINSSILSSTVPRHTNL